ncbi:MAG: histidine phosphatase family protein [Chloroflexi bacterium]|nr:histidine phosphatase family protein [Chloroflexota bacterium]
MRLILVRHGKAEYRQGPEGDNLYLSDLGKQQIERLGQWLQENEPGIDALICSPLRRARETTSILSRYVSAPIKIDDDLRETDHDLLMELPRLVHPADTGPHYYVLPHDNYYQRFAEQTRRVLNRLVENPSSVRTSVVICHGGTASTMLRLLLRCHHMYVWMHHAAMHYLTWQDGLWDLRGVNYAPHLPPELLTT